jgi:hypothetical protein
MKGFVYAVLFVICTLRPVSAEQTEVKSFLPTNNLESFMVEHFDIRTIRSSFAQKMTASQSHFSDLGMTPTITKNAIIFDSEDWVHSFEILKRADINGDSLEDVLVCFVDKAKVGTYNTQKPLLLTRYSSNSDIIAIAFEPHNESCVRSVQ